MLVQQRSIYRILWLCPESHHLELHIQQQLAAFLEAHDDQMVSTGHQPTHKTELHSNDTESGNIIHRCIIKMAL